MSDFINRPVVYLIVRNRTDVDEYEVNTPLTVGFEYDKADAERACRELERAVKIGKMTGYHFTIEEVTRFSELR